MGGSIVIDFTLQYPELVKSLILSGPSLNGYNFTVDDESKLLSLAVMSIARRDKDFNKSVEFMLDNPMWRQSNPRARQCLKNMFLDTSLEWALEDIEKTITPSASERLSEISKKILLIIGSEDSQPIKEIAGVLELIPKQNSHSLKSIISSKAAKFNFCSKIYQPFSIFKLNLKIFLQTLFFYLITGISLCITAGKNDFILFLT